MKIKKCNPLLLILVLYLCTLFVYKDFGIRIIFGYILLLVPLVFYLVMHKTRNIEGTDLAYAIIIIVILFAFFRPNSRIDNDTIAYIVAMLICFLYCIVASPDENQIRIIEKCVIGFATVFAIIVIISRIARDFYLNTIFRLLVPEVQALSLESLWHGYSCTIAGDDTFHNYIFMLATLFSLGRVAEATDHWGKHYFLSLFFVVSSFLTGRRGEFLSLFLIWLFVGLYIMSRTQRMRVIKIGAIFLICGIPFLPTMFSSPLFSRYSATISIYQSGNDIFSGRLELWSEAIRLFLDYPVFGIGWGGFSNYVSDEYRSYHGNVYNVHNNYLQFLAETGVIGALLIVSSLFWIIKHTIKQSVILRNYPERLTNLRKINTVAIGIQIYFLILGFIDPCFMKYYYWVFFSISLIFTKYIDRLFYQFGRNNNICERL